MNGKAGANTMKAGAGGIVALMEFLARVPGSVREICVVVMAFIVVDTLTGILAAGLTGEIASRKMTAKLVAKLVQYTILIAICSGAALLAKNWTFVSAGLMGIIGIEFVSMLENLVKLEKHGGVKLGPIRPILERVGRYLQPPPEPPKEQ